MINSIARESGTVGQFGQPVGGGGSGLSKWTKAIAREGGTVGQPVGGGGSALPKMVKAIARESGTVGQFGQPVGVAGRLCQK